MKPAIAFLSGFLVLGAVSASAHDAYPHDRYHCDLSRCEFGQGDPENRALYYCDVVYGGSCPFEQCIDVSMIGKLICEWPKSDALARSVFCSDGLQDDMWKTQPGWTKPEFCIPWVGSESKP